jgi:two-component system sensor histidine kinase KdpD
MASDKFHSNLKNTLTNKVRASRGLYHWRGYLLGLGLVILATLLGHLVREFFAPANIIMIYLLFVTVSAVISGLGPSILVSILSVLCFDFFFVQPHLTFAVADTQYIFTFVALLLVGITISYLTSRIRQQNETAVRRERETAALYALGRDLVIANNLESYTESIVKRIKDTLGLGVAILLPVTDNNKKLRIYPDTTELRLSEDDMNLAICAFQQRKAAGYKTEIFQSTMTQFIPLTTARGAIGTMVLREVDTTNELTIDKERLLRAYADLAAVAIEGIQLSEELSNTRVLKATEKLQVALLNAISHDLRTPLVSVIGVLSSLQEEGMELDDTAKRNLIQVAREDADRLNHLITNLLDESRIEAGALKLTKKPSEVQDLIGAALEQLGSRLGQRPIKIDIPVDIPFIYVDTGLIVQTLVNLMDNAFKYSPPDSLIEIKGQHIADEVYIEITDQGIGIPAQDLAHVFDKFYRINRPDTVTGTGMGLSISKGIIEAHGGSIVAENRPGGGTIMRVKLPVNNPKAQVKESHE